MHPPQLPATHVTRDQYINAHLLSEGYSIIFQADIRESLTALGYQGNNNFNLHSNSTIAGQMQAIHDRIGVDLSAEQAAVLLGNITETFRMAEAFSETPTVQRMTPGMHQVAAVILVVPVVVPAGQGPVVAVVVVPAAVAADQDLVVAVVVAA